MVAAKAFDAGHDNNPDLEEYKAANHAEDFPLWLFGVHLGEIPETRLSIHPDDGELTS